MAMHRLAISFLLVLALAQPALAQYRFQSWTADDGLPQNIITGIHQTRDGYLWIATLDGLARFDGMRFTVFNKANSPGIESNRFTSLYADGQGHLWLGTETGAITRFTRDRFITYSTAHGLPQSFIRGFTSDHTGRLWVLSGDTIVQWEPAREGFVRVEGPQAAGGYRTLAWGDRGGFWGVDRMGVRRFVGGVWELHPLPPPLLTDASVLGEEQDGTLWVSTPNGRFARIAGIGPDLARQLHWRAPSGKSWTVDVGPGLRRSLTLPSPMGRQTVAPTVLFEDADGNLWIGTDGNGLYRVQRQHVTVYSEAQGLVGRNVYPVLQDRAGAMWIGAWSGGLSRYQNGRFTNYTAREGLAPGGVTALHEDVRGRLWVATLHGLQTLEDGRFTTLDAGVLPAGATVQVIHQDRAGAVWLGTDRGLVRLVDGAATLLMKRDGLATDNVRVIIEASAGGLWIGGYGGLTLFRDGRFAAWTDADGLPGTTVRALHEDNHGVLWIGTYDTGLVRFAGGRFTRYGTREGLFNDGVFQILDDGRGFFWMSSNRGISRVSRQELEAVAAGERDGIVSIAYGTSDGMLNVECNGGLWPAGTRARDGTLWFPTQNGMAVIDPASVTTNPRPPPVVIESLLLDREPASVAADRPVSILPDVRSLEIAYTGLSFVNTERMRFKYRLEGLDEDWTDAGTRRTAYYSYVPPGRYTFTVVAANSDGLWNTEGARLQLVVLPPFYRTWWFLTLVTAGAAAVLVAAVKRREARLMQAHAVQQAFTRELIASQEADRKRIAAELHDSLGQRLVIIKNLAVLVSGVVIDGARARLDEISTEASQAIGEVREIAHNLRPHHLERLGLTKTLEALVRKAAGASTVAFTSEMNCIDGLFPKDAEIIVYRVVQESINNILKHSAATEARVTVRCTGAQVLITVRDNGRGFARMSGDHSGHRDGFGLRGITERVMLIGGRADIRSAPGQGTTIVLDFNLTASAPPAGEPGSRTAVGATFSQAEDV
jgi:signal transduction histidine kinase/ligand-binding sensor domain-containing protein